MSFKEFQGLVNCFEVLKVSEGAFGGVFDEF